MKKLSEILRQQSVFEGFPVLGMMTVLILIGFWR